MRRKKNPDEKKKRVTYTPASFESKLCGAIFAGGIDFKVYLPTSRKPRMTCVCMSFSWDGRQRIRCEESETSKLFFFLRQDCWTGFPNHDDPDRVYVELFSSRCGTAAVAAAGGF